MAKIIMKIRFFFSFFTITNNKVQLHFPWLNRILAKILRHIYLYQIMSNMQISVQYSHFLIGFF